MDQDNFKNKRESYHKVYEALLTDGDQDGPGDPTQNDYHHEYPGISQSKIKQK